MRFQWCFVFVQWKVGGLNGNWWGLNDLLEEDWWVFGMKTGGFLNGV